MDIYLPEDGHLQDCYECCHLQSKLIQLENFDSEIFLICKSCLWDAFNLLEEK